MTRSTTLTLALAALLAAGAPALAHDQGMMGRGPMGGGEGFDFAAVDTDKDGKITAAELQAHRAAEVAKADADADGKLSAAELAALHVARMTAGAEARAARMVSALDANGDGLLDAAEMATRPGPEIAFDRLDADSDGALTEAELAAAGERMGRGEGRHGDGRGHGHGKGWFGGHD